MWRAWVPNQDERPSGGPRSSSKRSRTEAVGRPCPNSGGSGRHRCRLPTGGAILAERAARCAASFSPPRRRTPVAWNADRTRKSLFRRRIRPGAAAVSGPASAIHKPAIAVAPGSPAGSRQLPGRAADRPRGPGCGRATWRPTPVPWRRQPSGARRRAAPVRRRRCRRGSCSARRRRASPCAWRRRGATHRCRRAP